MVELLSIVVDPLVQQFNSPSCSTIDAVMEPLSFQVDTSYINVCPLHHLQTSVKTVPLLLGLASPPLPTLCMSAIVGIDIFVVSFIMNHKSKRHTFSSTLCPASISWLLKSSLFGNIPASCQSQVQSE